MAPKPYPTHVVDKDGLSRWSETHGAAWTGFMQAQRQLTRELDSELEAQHALGLSGLELLGRLAAAKGRVLRLSVLAGQAGLSLSRVSRIVDALEQRGLLERRQCDGDGRAKNACLTAAGIELLAAAQATHFSGVQRLFFDRLSEDELETLAQIFARFSQAA